MIHHREDGLRFHRFLGLALAETDDPILAFAAAEQALEQAQMQAALAVIDEGLAELQAELATHAPEAALSMLHRVKEGEL